jgi:magnesium transporter
VASADGERAIELGTDPVVHAGRDHEATSHPSVCASPVIRGKARTRLYRSGKLAAQGFSPEELRELLADPNAVAWLDLCHPAPEDLRLAAEQFGLAPVDVEDAATVRDRPKLERFHDHLLVNVYATGFDAEDGRLISSEIALVILERGLITIRKDPHFHADPLIAAWDADDSLARFGVTFLVYGLIDHVVDSHFATIQAIDDAVETLEDELFDPRPQGVEVQRHSFEVRKSLVRLRRVVLPMREVVNALMRRDLRFVATRDMASDYQDLYDHVLRATEWTEGLRDLLATTLETNIMLQDQRLNQTVRKLTGWAAVIAVPTAITGYFGMNVPFPGRDHFGGWLAAVILIVTVAAAMFVLMRRRGWI